LEPITLQLPRGASVAMAVKTLAPVLPSMRREPSALRFRVNGLPAKPADEMNDGDELSIAEGAAELISPDRISAPRS
jgi:hypothetical protein